MAKVKETYQVYIKQEHEAEHGVHCVEFYWEDVLYLLEASRKASWVFVIIKNKIEEKEEA